MVQALTVAGADPYYTVSGGKVTNNNPETWNDLHNLTQSVTDLDTAGIQVRRQYNIAPPASGGTYQIPANIDAVIVYSSGGSSITGTLTLVFPQAPVVGQELKIAFGSAVTTLALSIPTGYALAGTSPTSATANTSIRYQLANATGTGLLWMSA